MSVLVSFSVSELVRHTLCFLRHISHAVCLLPSVAEEERNFKNSLSSPVIREISAEILVVYGGRIYGNVFRFENGSHVSGFRNLLVRQQHRRELLNQLESMYLGLRELIVQRITVVKFAVYVQCIL